MASPRSRRETADYYRDRRRRKVCNFCVDKAESIDYKEVNRLRRYLSERAKIEPRRKTGTCAGHQRELAVALKRARHVALLPYALVVMLSPSITSAAVAEQLFRFAASLIPLVPLGLFYLRLSGRGGPLHADWEHRVSLVSIRSWVIRFAVRLRSIALRLEVSRPNCLPAFL